MSEASKPINVVSAFSPRSMRPAIAALKLAKVCALRRRVALNASRDALRRLAHLGADDLVVLAGTVSGDALGDLLRAFEGGDLGDDGGPLLLELRGDIGERVTDIRDPRRDERHLGAGIRRIELRVQSIKISMQLVEVGALDGATE